MVKNFRWLSLDSSGSLQATTVATYCPGRMTEHPNIRQQEVFTVVNGHPVDATQSYLVVLYLSLVREVELGEWDAVLLPVGAAARVQRERPQVVPPDVPLGVNLRHAKLSTRYRVRLKGENASGKARQKW